MGLFKNLNFGKLKSGLSKTRERIVNTVSETLSGQANLDEDALDEIEEILITSDIGYDTAMEVITKMKNLMIIEKDRSTDSIINVLKKVLEENLTGSSASGEYEPDLEYNKPYVVLVVGVNGAGKTTTIGKLARNFKNSGFSVMIGAADTFRAAANEQLEVWAERAGVEIIRKAQGSDPSAVAYETLETAVNKNSDVVLIDTAGRLHTKNNLMEELKKIKRVIGKKLEGAPHETFLVIDGNTGQNAIVQAQAFTNAIELSGLIITKLDGTAKGGVVFQIANKLALPVRYIGVGEGIEDLQNFDAKLFIDALFGEQKGETN